MQIGRHERLWNGTAFGMEMVAVDRNLKDEWLARLNGLGTLKLTNICEGHVHTTFGTGQERYPYVTLHLRERAAAALVGREAAVEQIFHALFPADADRHQLCLARNESLMTLRSPHVRQKAEAEPQMEDWFSATITRLEEFDRRCGDLLKD